MKRTLKGIVALSLATTLIMGLMPFSALRVNAAKVNLSKSKLTLEVGEKATLKVKGISSKTKVKWSSSKKSVATVSQKGVVKAKKKGKTTITAAVKGKKYKCKATVSTPRLDAGFYLAEMPLLGTYEFEAYNATGKVNWTSSDNNIISIRTTGDKSCTISAEGIGTAVITASCKGMISDKCEITVNSRGYYIKDVTQTDMNLVGTYMSLNLATYDEAKLREKYTQEMKATQEETGRTDEDITNDVESTLEFLKNSFVNSATLEYYFDRDLLSGVTWRSDNEAVATVNNGVVTAKSEGYAYIIASYKDADGKVHEEAMQVIVYYAEDPLENLFGCPQKGLAFTWALGYAELSADTESMIVTSFSDAYLDGKEIYGQDSDDTTSLIKWTSSDPSVFTIVEEESDKYIVSVKYVGPGTAYLIGTYQGATFKYLVICR